MTFLQVCPMIELVHVLAMLIKLHDNLTREKIFSDSQMLAALRASYTHTFYELVQL